MKKILLIAAAFISFAAGAQEKKADDLIQVKTEVYNFGKIKQGVPVTYYFEITNVSNKPVVIENTWAGCGCTTPGKIEQPIAPKATTRMKVDYNAAAAAPFEKDVFVKVAGVNEPKVLKIKGEVLDAAAYEAYVKSDEYKKAQAARAAKKAAAPRKK
ncbi:MAG TPA: DUF1573 domain-containing protein [Chitinophagaceae bacterium]|jgi:hypothetical protein|nr:DUF1573 domain-containing protein [Chitinophagaceae bacterium]